MASRGSIASINPSHQPFGIKADPDHWVSGSEDTATPGKTDAADGGDSGCPVFGIEDASELEMTTALASDETRAKRYALFRQQSVLFLQLEEKTGVQWASASSG